MKPAVTFTRTPTTWLAYLLTGYFLYLQSALGPLMPFLRAELDMRLYDDEPALQRLRVGRTARGPARGAPLGGLRAPPDDLGRRLADGGRGSTFDRRRASGRNAGGNARDGYVRRVAPDEPAGHPLRRARRGVLRWRSQSRTWSPACAPLWPRWQSGRSSGRGILGWRGALLTAVVALALVFWRFRACPQVPGRPRSWAVNGETVSPGPLPLLFWGYCAGAGPGGRRGVEHGVLGGGVPPRGGRIP